MPKMVVRKSYRCQPGKRRDVLAALQKIDAAAAEAGYPRGRYVFVETRAPGEPDLEVEFTFESYAEMERLERAMRERVARYLREGGAAGQEHLLEPSATKHLLLVEATAAGTTTTSAWTPTAQTAVTQTRASAAPRAAPQAPQEPADLTFDEDEDDESFEPLPEPEVPAPPQVPAGMTPEQARRAQLDRARAALQGAERAVGQTPRRPPRAS